jgi:uncharacterized LabA/DUF88 family protein
MDASQKSRVYALIDGFNFYHALDKFDHGKTEAEQTQYQQYKWLCFRTLVQRFVKPAEELVGVKWFTAYPFWDNAKRMRHQLYVTVMNARGVQHTLGEFKSKHVECRAKCGQPFDMREEKQTDVNIATQIIELAEHYDKLILVTADSDQVPAVKLLLKLHPQKTVFILPPIGRNSKELVKAANGNRLIMKEDDLLAAVMPNPVEITRDGKQVQIWKPANWLMPKGNLGAEPSGV